jgi:dihydroxyacetone kinase
VTAFADRIVELGKAETGDKTMVDALLPFVETFGRLVGEGQPASKAWEEAALHATEAAAATADLLPLKGRARPLAEKSLGTPDPGATSLAMVFTVMGPHFTDAPGSAQAVPGRDQAIPGREPAGAQA